MQCCRTNSLARAGRITLGVVITITLVLVGLWLLQMPRTGTAMTFLPATHPKSSQENVAAQPHITAEEIMARFPQEKHQEFMRRAIANSYKAGVQYKTGGAFGAVIVTKEGDVIADGVNHVIAENDPTWHGEMHAIRQACALLKSPKLEGCVLYTSSEPCPMCLATAYWARLDGIVYGATVADSKEYGNFDDVFIYAELAKPAADRVISEQSLLRGEAVEVWKQYQARPDKVDY
jgi:tRNA(Arg) A34 adenosine deaminase TadA